MGFKIENGVLMSYTKEDGLTDVVIPDGVTSIGDDAFYGCSRPISITIPDSVTSISERAFYNCSKITSINISENNKNYTSIDGVLFSKDKKNIIYFPVGKKCTDYIIPNSVTSIGKEAFYCLSLKSITIPYGVTSISEKAFYGCSRLTSITIPDSVTSVGNAAFFWCKSLESIIIPDSVTSIGRDAFSKCSSLASINVYENNKNYASIDGVLFSKDKKEIVCFPTGKKYTEYIIPDSVTSIGREAFYYCSNLTSITIPDSVTSIGREAFYYCSNLTSITIPDSVNSIDDFAFYGCSNLKSIIIPDSVTSIGYWAFEHCSSLTSITIPDSVTSIGGWAFSDCSSLTSINVSENNKNYTSIDGVLFSKDKKEIICFPTDKKYTEYIIPDSVTSIVCKAFYKCSSLTSITIPANVNSIGKVAFSDCSSLTSITIKSGDSSITINDNPIKAYGSFNADTEKIFAFMRNEAKEKDTILSELNGFQYKIAVDPYLIKKYDSDSAKEFIKDNIEYGHL